MDATDIIKEVESQPGRAVELRMRRDHTLYNILGIVAIFQGTDETTIEYALVQDRYNDRQSGLYAYCSSVTVKSKDIEFSHRLDEIEFRGYVGNLKKAIGRTS